MMNDEQYLRNRMGDRNPFRVPDGYFDSLAAEVMQKLPERQHVSRFTRLRPWLYAAVFLFVAVLTATVYFVAPESNREQIAVTTTQDSYFEDAADYVMADNNDIYACLASDY